MKYLLRNIVPVALLVCALNVPAFAQSRVATVDLKKLFDNYWKTTNALVGLKERAADLDKEYRSLLDDFKKASADYQKLQADANDQAVSAEERDKRKKGAEAKLTDIEKTKETLAQFERQARSTIEGEQNVLREKILTEIRTVLTAKAKSAGISLLLDSAAKSADLTPIVLFDSGENDLTDAVLSQLNASAPLSTPAPVEKKEEKKDEKK